MVVKLAIDTSRANAQSGQATKSVVPLRTDKAPPMRLIAGPCLLESVERGWNIASRLVEITKDLPIELIFKASVLKANRTRGSSTRQLVSWTKAAELFGKIYERYGICSMTDVHEPQDVGLLHDMCIPQIPALMMRQTDLIEAAASGNGLIHIKKGQFAAPEDMQWVVEKVRAVNDDCHIMISERGHSFGYYNLVVDMRSFPIMKATAGADEILFDATHSVQLPSSATDGTSGGLREFIDPLARAAIVSGADGLFCEVHDDPQHALSDGPCQIPLHRFEDFLRRILELREWVIKNPLDNLSP